MKKNYKFNKLIYTLIASALFSEFVMAENRTEFKLGVSNVANPLLLTSDIAIASTQYNLDILNDSDYEFGQTTLYYKLNLSGKTFSQSTVKKNAELLKANALLGLSRLVFSDRAIINFQVLGQKISGRALEITGGSDGRKWDADAYGAETSISIPVFFKNLKWTPRFMIGFENHQFDQKEQDEFSTASFSNNQSQNLKIANEFVFPSNTRLQLAVSSLFKNYNSRPSRYTDGRSDLALETEKLRTDRIELESYFEFDAFTFKANVFQQNELDLRLSALDADSTGGLISVEFTDFFGLRPALELSQESRKFKNFRAGSAALQDFNILRKDTINAYSFKFFKSFKSFNVDLGFTKNANETNFKELKIENEITTLNLSKEI